MSATTLKLPADLKQRIAAVVEGTRQSPHAFMLEAIERETRLAEDRGRFVADALVARDDALRSVLGHPADAVHAYMTERAAGRRAPRPKAKKWRE